MDRYIGIDVHAQSCSVAVIGPSGRKIRQTVLPTRAAELRRFVREVPGARHVCFEEGLHSEWLYEVLEPLSERTQVVQPQARRGSKSDSQDALDLAEGLRTDRFARRVYKAGAKQKWLQELRQAVFAYGLSRRELTRSKTQLRMLLLSRGIQANQKLYVPEAREQWLRKLPSAHRRRAEPMASRVDALQQSCLDARVWLEEAGAKLPDVKRVRTAPGFGLVRSCEVVAVMMTPWRFRTKRHLWSYAGLAVVTRVTAQWTPVDGRMVRTRQALTRGLNKSSNKRLKNVFVGAAMRVIQVPDHPLTQAYERQIERGTKPTLARLTVARKLAAAVLAMWKNKEDYDASRHVKIAE